jgi:hypothetical protein
MNDVLNESAIVTTVAQEAANRITKKIIRDLQRMTYTLSGEDSGLKTTWDEICVQIQYEMSFYWDAYDDVVHSIARGYITELSKHEREAIWLQTQEGEDWTCEDPEEREENPVFDGDIVNYLVHSYVYAEASRWSNARIRAYLE